MLALVVAVAVGAQSAAPPAADDAKTQISRLEHQWGQAFVKRDFAFLDRIVAPEFRLFVAQDSGAYTATARDEWLRNAAIFRYDSFAAETVDVHRVGDTAVASVRIVNTGALRPGEPPSMRRSFVTDTWVRRNGRWQVVHRYSHRLPVKAAPK